ncbi:MAG: 50S ribosomal protein L15 [candidate division TM6 bacterium GW2011_GWE2_41_16]|nr:MAG: 50S ribosomal protein L15 [candidate division TM6 bacterium GW2011_GWE2_41_16]
MISLHTLTPLLKKRKCIGRGGSRGGTSGRGHKGQKARTSGTVGPLFEGGQMPLARRLPKRGFNNADFKTSYELIALKDLESHFEQGAVIDMAALVTKGLIKDKKDTLIKILANGSLQKKLVVNAHAFSEAARDAIVARGGEARIIEKR